MAYASPTAGSALNSPSHSLLHRQFDIDTSASEQSMVIDNTGNVGIGTTSPTAVLHLKAGTATASTAPIKLTSGVVNTTPEAGTIEFDGTDLFFSIA